jgi:protein SCO1/2
MKTPAVVLCLGLQAAAATLIAAEAPAPCCPPPDPAKAAPCCPAPAPEVARKEAPCCTELAAARPLSAKSLYQLDVTWTNDAGQAVSLASFRGRPLTLAMIFASCEYACPVLVDDIRRMRALLPEEARANTPVVLVSFDTVRDTPAALRAFRDRMKLDGAWTLLRGDAAPVQELAMLLGVKFKQDARGQFAHSNLFTVLNTEGEIVHQHAGLMGDVSSPAKVIASLGR